VTAELAAVVSTCRRGRAAWLSLERTGRHNALVPELVDDLRRAIAAAIRSDAVCIVLTGSGRSFSTGGDLGGFLAQAGEPARLRSYANRLVGTLHQAILDLLTAPMPVVARINGPVTGGALGLVLAADLVAMHRDAFLQPYYSEVGFAPDGGWTALLPERIGAAKASEIQLLNHRIDASEALRLGLASALGDDMELEDIVSRWVEVLAAKERESLATTRRLIWDAPRRGLVSARLDAEREAFVALVTRPVVAERIATFIEANKKSPRREEAHGVRDRHRSETG
jgi:2-(1,2-epoxy-1,2-dihydrophenyl)acetyl-CoA isomerase